MKILLLIVGLGLCLTVAAVDRNKFKTCGQSGFCKRNREYAAQSGKVSPYRIVSGSKPEWNGEGYTIRIENQANHKQFELKLFKYGEKLFRVKINEVNPLKPRYEVQDVLLSKVIPLKEQAASQTSKLWNTIEIKMDPLIINFFDGDQLILSTNGGGLLNIEPLLNEAEKNQFITEQQQTNEQFRKIATPTEWSEHFGGDTDPQKNGPQSVSVDFVFPGNTGTSRLYGIPEHADSHALRETLNEDGTPKLDPYRLYNLDVFEYELKETMALYAAVPLMYHHSTERTTGVFWLNAAETWIDISKNSNGWKSHWYSESGIIDFFVLLGHSPKETLNQYAQLTGFQALPPIFSIAYHQCRWNYKDQDDVRDVAAKFDEHNIPFDVIWLDIEHTDSKKYFTWDPIKFSQSKEMIDNVASKGRKMVTIVDPHIKREHGYFIYDSGNSEGVWVKKNGEDYEGFCWPGASMYPDYTSPAVRNWWASKFVYDSYLGSTPDLYTWNDMNEPSVFNGPEVTMQKYVTHRNGWEHRDVHNLYGMYFHMATYQGHLTRAPNSRPFILTRSAFAGSQRYGALWTGDNKADWSHLEASVPMLLSLGVSGIAFSGADVGGFFGNPSTELLLRWYQLGIYQPFFRAHAHIDSNRREPWLFGDDVTNKIRLAVRERYSILPYFYTLFFVASETGIPPMRPMWLEYPKESTLFDLDTQYMLGSDLLVAPVTKPDQKFVNVAFPGVNPWYDIKTFAKVEPGQNMNVPLADTYIPVYQRGGSILPRKQRPRRSTAQMKFDPYTLIVALDNQGEAEGILYLDDESTFEFIQGKRTLRKFSFKQGVLTNSDLNIGQFSSPAEIERIVFVGLRNVPVSATLALDGTKSALDFDSNASIVTIRKPNCPVTRNWTITLSR